MPENGLSMPAPKRPPLILSETDAERLFALAARSRPALPALCDLLMAEIDRAEVRPDHRAPPDVVGMNATVEFIDESHGRPRTVQLVYPRDADIAAGRISVLTPIGAGLIGLRPGQRIDWPDREGRQRRLRVVSVSRPVAASAPAL
jgi:regulator of nucleoside diphosphate kinase